MQASRPDEKGAHSPHQGFLTYFSFHPDFIPKKAEVADWTHPRHSHNLKFKLLTLSQLLSRASSGVLKVAEAFTWNMIIHEV